VSEEVSEEELAEAEKVRDALANMLFRWLYPDFAWNHSTGIAEYDYSWELERQKCLSFAGKLMFCFHICNIWDKEAGHG